MAALTEEQLKRISRIAWAAKGGHLKEQFPNFSVDDVKLLADRLDELDLEDNASAEPLMGWVLDRLKEDRANKAAWLEDALENVRIAELCLNEAIEAQRAVEALIGGALLSNGDRINAHWDDVVAGYYVAGLLPRKEPAPPAEAEEPTAEPPPVPASAEPPPKEQEPETAPPTVSEPETLPSAAMPPQRQPGALSTTKPGDPLTEKQEKVFRAILSATDAEWRAQISQGRMAAIAGLKPGGLWAHIDALERKDYIRILDRGNSLAAGIYWICERARPERDVAPKSDAELIAEAVAAGRVTKVPSPGSKEVH